MKQLITRRHGILTNVPALHALNRHCCGEHQHVPGEGAGQHTEEFAITYCKLVCQDVRASNVFFFECWGNRFTTQMLRLGATVVRPPAEECTPSKIRLTLLSAIGNKAGNLIWFWISKERNQGNER